MNLFKAKQKEAHKDTKTLKCVIDGMHCSSCAMNIDGALEDLPGIVSATTQYANSKTVVQFDPATVSEESILRTIKEAGYLATIDEERG